MARRASPALLCAVALAFAGGARAACTTAPPVLDLYHAYSDLIDGAGTPRETIGRYVLQNSFDAARADELAEAVAGSSGAASVPEIRAIYDAARDLARTGAYDPAVDIGRHFDLRDRLANTYVDDECLLTALAPEDLAVTTTTAAQGEAEAQQGDLLSLAHAALVAATLAALVAAAAAWRIWRRRGSVEEIDRQFPRLPIELDVIIRPARGPALACRMRDISRGGFRTDRPEGTAPGEGAAVTVSLAGHDRAARVRWHNDHFTGFLLDQALTSEELTEVLAASVPADTPESKAAPPPETPQKLSA